MRECGVRLLSAPDGGPSCDDLERQRLQIQLILLLDILELLQQAAGLFLSAYRIQCQIASLVQDGYPCFGDTSSDEDLLLVARSDLLGAHLREEEYSWMLS